MYWMLVIHAVYVLLGLAEGEGVEGVGGEGGGELAAFDGDGEVLGGVGAVGGHYVVFALWGACYDYGHVGVLTANGSYDCRARGDGLGEVLDGVVLGGVARGAGFGIELY